MCATKQKFTMALTGDSFIASKLSCYKEAEFLRVFETIRAQDLGFTNLEVLLNDYKGIPAAQSGGTYAGTPTSLVDEIKWAGFEMVARANNHSLDYSYEGMRVTTQTLDEKGITHAGVGENLAEARSPAYHDTSFGRVALMSASSSFAPWGRAGASRPDFQGRPGLSALRYTTTYHVTQTDYEAIKQMKESLGLRIVRQQNEKFGWGPSSKTGEISFQGLTFVKSESPGIHTQPHPSDLKDITKWIGEARRQSDWVLFTLHAHESHIERTLPAEFVVDFARKCIDAGADMFIGHGPHLLRGIEIYKDKPIFYSLGNFIFQNDLIAKHPQDIYDRFGLSSNATPADIYDVRSKNDTAGFPGNPLFWESVIAIPHYDTGEIKKIELVPLCLGYGKPRPQRGRPFIASKEKSIKILEDLKQLSQPFGTEITIKENTGIITLA